MLIDAVRSPIVGQMKAALILPMDSRQMPLSRVRADAAQTHRFPEFLQAPRYPLGGFEVRAAGGRCSRPRDRLWGGFAFDEDFDGV